jgi:DnaJ-domain-containing protein 1
MSEEEIWAAQSPYPQWESEVSAFARHADPRRPAASIDDPLGVLRWKAGERPRAGRGLTPADRRALDVLGLGEDASLDEVKRRYRLLVRRYHPDSNAGDRRHEARLQAVRDAHAHLAASTSFARMGEG